MRFISVAIPVATFLVVRGHSMHIGYAGSSTIDQEAGYQVQIQALNAVGCDKIFAEKVSSVAQRLNSRLITPAKATR